MKCTEIQHMLTESLSRGREKEITEHLEACAECREFYRSIRELDALSGELRSQVRAPEGFHDRVISTHEGRSSGGWFSFRSVMASFSLAACLTGALLTWDQLRNDGAWTSGIFPVEEGFNDSMEAKGVPDYALDRDENSYMEVTIDSEDEEALILRLPPVIEIHRTEIPDETTHYHTVSY